MNYSYDEILNKDIMQILSRLPLKALRKIGTAVDKKTL